MIDWNPFVPCNAELTVYRNCLSLIEMCILRKGIMSPGSDGHETPCKPWLRSCARLSPARTPVYDESSSDEASMGASLSPSSIGAPSSSLSSSLLLFTPCAAPESTPFPLVPASDALAAVVGGAGGRAAVVVDDGGALNMDCCNSVVVTSLPAATGRR